MSHEQDGGMSCLPCRKVGKDTAQQLATALAVAEGASAELLRRAQSAADNAAAEVQACEALQEIMAGKADTRPGSSAADALTQAIHTAKQFPNLEVHLLPSKLEVERHSVLLAVSIFSLCSASCTGYHTSVAVSMQSSSFASRHSACT